MAQFIPSSLKRAFDLESCSIQLGKHQTVECFPLWLPSTKSIRNVDMRYI